MEGKISILLIEDNPADSELVSIFLRGIYAGKSKLATAATLDEGIKLLQNSTVDVIILDFHFAR